MNHAMVFIINFQIVFRHVSLIENKLLQEVITIFE